MFGSLRFLLAYLVVISHLLGGEQFVHLGFYAVRGCFVLSGFLMTAALNDIYRFDPVRYWSNRALRLLPLYYLTAIVTLLVVLALPQQAAAFRAVWSDINGADVVLNFLILPLQFSTTHFVLVLPYWSVAVEIVMYFMLWLVIARNESFAIVALGAGIAYHFACIYSGLEWDSRYMATPSALFPFALGALVYFLNKRGALDFGWPLTLFAIGCWTLNLLAGTWFLPPEYVNETGYYFDTLCFAVIVAGLARNRLPALVGIDRMLGDLAYPVFLVHILVAFLVSWLLLSGEPRGLALLLASTPLVIALAALMEWLQKRLVEPTRDRIRSGEAPERPISISARAGA